MTYAYDLEDKERRAVELADRIKHVTKVADEIGTRPAARRLGISKDTVTRYLALSGDVLPICLKLDISQLTPASRPGPRRWRATFTGKVREKKGKQRKTVRFKGELEAATIQEVLEAALHQAAVQLRKKALGEANGSTEQQR